MYSGNSKGISYTSGFFLLIGLWVVGLVLGSLAAIPVWLLMGSGSIMDMGEGIISGEYAMAARVIQVITTSLAFFIPAYVTARIVSSTPSAFLGFNTRFNANQVVLSCALIFLGGVVASSSAQIMEGIPLPAALESRFRLLEDNYAAQVESIASMNSFGEYLLALVMIAALPGLFEEVFFRGGMQNLLMGATRKVWFSIIFTSIIFSLVHFSFYGFLARVCLGIVLGLMFHYSKNLWLSVIAHFMYNGIAVTQMYFVIRQGKSLREAMDEKVDPWWGVVAVIALYFLFIFFKRITTAYLATFAPSEQDTIGHR